MDNSIPLGLCQCGCGQPAPIAKRSNSQKGHVAGQPVRFIVGHQGRKYLPQPQSTPKLCECGCGQLTLIAEHTNGKHGIIKGQFCRFIKGHGNRRPAIDRFWPKVDSSGGPDACWPWLASLNAHGYGQFTIGGRKQGIASRVAWELTNGPIPPDKDVCHHCDNPPCCNPAHLFLGTAADNMQDCKQKGRNARGERSGPTKLTAAQVQEIRARYNPPACTMKMLAREYGVTVTPIQALLSRRTWQHIP